MLQISVTTVFLQIHPRTCHCINKLLMENRELLDSVAQYVTNLFNEDKNEHLPYHNWYHTKKVVGHCNEIAKHYLLDEKQQLILQIAAWFHDVGHLFGGWKNHEALSVSMMQDFMDQNHPKAGEILIPIAQCIMATKLPPEPSSLLDEIICDADNYHFGTTAFTKTDPLVRKEMEEHSGMQISEWCVTSLSLLRKHKFFTTYCQEKLSYGKAMNIAWLEAKTKRLLPTIELHDNPELSYKEQNL